MKKAWNEFWKDYKAICKDGNKFYKKHWKGTIVWCLVTYVISYGFGLLVGKMIAGNNKTEDDFELYRYIMNEPVNDIHEEGEEE